MVVWARAKLISMFYTTVIHRLWPRCCLSRRDIGPLKQYKTYLFSFEQVVWVIWTSKRCQSTAGAIPGSPPPWCIYRWIHTLCSDPPYHSLLKSWAVDKNDPYRVKKGNYLGNYSIYEHRVWWAGCLNVKKRLTIVERKKKKFYRQVGGKFNHFLVLRSMDCEVLFISFSGLLL